MSGRHVQHLWSSQVIDAIADKFQHRFIKLLHELIVNAEERCESHTTTCSGRGPLNMLEHNALQSSDRVGEMMVIAASLT